MRSLFLLVLVALLASVGLIALIESDPGYVLISYGLTTIEMSLWVGLILLLVFSLACYALFRLWRNLWGAWGNIGEWREDRKLGKGQRLASRGLFHYMEGDWVRARKLLLRSAKRTDAPALSYLMAARASHALQDRQAVEENLKAAELAGTGASELVGLTRAELLLEMGQLDTAVGALKALRAEGCKTDRLLRLELRAYRALGRWGELVPLLPQLRKRKILSREEAQALEREVYSGLLMMADTESPAAADEVWSTCPEALRRDPAILSRYVAGLLRHGDHALADKLLERALKKQWDARLVDLYGLVASGEPARRQKVAERWLQQHPEDAVLLRCLGRLALRNELWGQALDYFESSFRVQRSTETCAELARLLFNLGERERSAQCYREGLLLRENRLPDLPQPSMSKNR